jgi:hypothetical protein
MLKKLKKINKYLFGIVFLALLLRLIGAEHDFPFVFHPDEPTIVRSALGVRFGSNPKHFDWPHLYIYLNYFLFMGFATFRKIITTVGLKPLVSGIFPIIWNEGLIFYLLTRVFGGILGALTAVPIYLAGKILFNKTVGYFSALAFIIIPFHVWSSHFSLPDVPMIFFLAWGLYFSARIFVYNKRLDYILAGFLVGLSASTKYNGGLSALTVPLALFLRWISDRKKYSIRKKDFANLLLAGLLSIFGFVLGTPYAVLDYDTFSIDSNPKGAYWQFKNVGSVNLSEHILKLPEELIHKIPDDFGYAIFLGAILGLVILIFQLIKNKKVKKDYAAFLFVLPMVFFFWYVSGFEKSRSQYYMILYPYVALSFGYFLAKAINIFPKIRYIIVLLFLLPPLFFSIRNVYALSLPETRVVLYEELRKKLAPGDVVVYVDSNIEPILAKLSNKSYKGTHYLKIYKLGYFVASSDEEIIRTRNYLSKIFPLVEQVSIEGNERKGPSIAVFSFGK